MWRPWWALRPVCCPPPYKGARSTPPAHAYRLRWSSRRCRPGTCVSTSRACVPTTAAASRRLRGDCVHACMQHSVWQHGDDSAGRPHMGRRHNGPLRSGLWVTIPVWPQVGHLGRRVVGLCATPHDRTQVCCVAQGVSQQRLCGMQPHAMLQATLASMICKAAAGWHPLAATRMNRHAVGAGGRGGLRTLSAPGPEPACRC